MVESTISPDLSLDALHADFQKLLPPIERYARAVFNDIRCPHRRDECIAEVTGLCWKWFVRLAERGKDARQFPSVLASYACRAVKSCRRVCGQERANDVMSPLAQQRHAFRVERLAFATCRPHG